MDRWFTNVSSSVIRYITTMSILKHILTYIYNTGDSKNLIVSFIDSITENMNKINKIPIIRICPFFIRSLLIFGIKNGYLIFRCITVGISGGAQRRPLHAVVGRLTPIRL
jgi:hypothetical protein